MSKRNKVLVVGLDGASPDLLFNLASEGALPTINGIMREGAYGKLRSTIPPITCPAWVSSITGVNIGKHGIHDFFLSVDINKKEIVFANSAKRKAEAIWNIPGFADKKVVVLNFPVSYPPEKVNGVMVSGVLTPSLQSEFTYPKNLKDELLELDYEIDVADTMLDEILAFKSDKIRMLSRITEIVRKRVIAAKYLMKQFEWDLFIVVFVALDRIHHLYWRYIDPKQIAYNAEDAKTIYPCILQCYVEVDGAISSLLKSAGKDTNLIVYSDHGFRPLNRTFFTNNLLLKKGFLKLKKHKRIDILPSQETFVKKIPKLHLEGVIGKLPSRMKRKIRPLFAPSREFLDIFGIEPSETKAFQFGYSFIRINKEIVSDEKEYERIRRDIIGLFNKQLFEDLSIRAYRKEDLYSGPRLNNLPDIIMMPEKDVTPRQLITMNNSLIMNYNEALDVPSLMWNGDHSLFGVILMRGPKTGKNCLIKGANIMDVAPTILQVMKEPVPRYMDGKVIKEAIINQKPRER